MTTTTLSPTPAAAPADASPARGPAAARARRKRVLHWIAVHSVAIAVALLFILPFVFVFLTSVMSDSQAMSGDLWPDSWHWENYKAVFETDGFLDWWKNSCSTRASGPCSPCARRSPSRTRSPSSASAAAGRR